MKKISSIIFVLAMALVFSIQAEAALQSLGTDSRGNRLIYDTDLDITWYDYDSNGASNAWTWDDQIAWVDALTVSFGNAEYEDWRLPTTTQPDPSCDTQYDLGGGYPLQGEGYNCTGSEMGHLYYTELGNSAGGPLSNTGDFQTLAYTTYWSGTEYAPDTDNAWFFNFGDGAQNDDRKNGTNYKHAIAVRDGLAVVPEPISSTLFLIGGATLGFRRLRKRG